MNNTLVLQCHKLSTLGKTNFNFNFSQPIYILYKTVN